MRVNGLAGLLKAGNLSADGYKESSKDKNRENNYIPSGDITMKNVKSPIKGTDNLGNTKVMQPGRDYKFQGTSVWEEPAK